MTPRRDPDDAGTTADLADLERALGHEFADRGLLSTALVHRSYRTRRPGAQSNERLEFLGDAVLGLSVTTEIYGRYPDSPEGELAPIRAAVVNEVTLADLAREIDLGRFLFLDKGEDATGGRDKASILADAMEAVLGAVYLDGGWDVADALVRRLLDGRIADAWREPALQESKNRLQEMVVHRFSDRPRYEVSSEGPDHDRRFRAVVHIEGAVRGEGEGSTSTKAQLAAAAAAIEWLDATDSTTRAPERRVRAQQGSRDA
ncbi:MAG: ribonuclease III [Acidimicrobiia bacterium]